MEAKHSFLLVVQSSLPRNLHRKRMWPMDVVDHSSTHFRQRNILADTSPSRGGVGGYHSDPTPDATHTDPILSDPITVDGSKRESDTQTDIRIPTKSDSDFFIIVAGQPMDVDEINK